MVAFLEKPAESDGFHEIIDFLNANQIHYALTVNPTIYISCIQQFWATAKAKTVNGERQIQSLIDKRVKGKDEATQDEGVDSRLLLILFNTLYYSYIIISISEVQYRRNRRKDNAVAQEEMQQDDSVPTPSNDLPLSEKEKDAQAKEIVDLKKRVQRLERKKKSRTTGLKRLKKVGMSRRVKSSKDQESLGDHEDDQIGEEIDDIDISMLIFSLGCETGEVDDADIV
ncbi:hypothetical protein Tco_0867974 [Tanacetum coccineum]